MASVSEFDKEKFLEALESDRMFRHAVMGLLGLKEILDRITRIEERIVEVEKKVVMVMERQEKLEEKFAELEERQQRLEERIVALEERFARLEERFARLEERQQRLEEHQQRLEERQQRLEERMAEVLSELRELRRVSIVIAHRFGVLGEAGFREAMRHVVEEVLGVARVERWVYRDDEGFVYGYPSVIDVDLVIKDDKHILVEVKSRVSRGDVAELYRIGRLYERVRGVKPYLVIVGGFIDPEAYRAGARLGVEIKPAFKED